MTDREIIEKLIAANEGEQVPFPDEETKGRARDLRNQHLPTKQLYLTIQADYDLWLKRPFGNAPTPGS